MIKIVLRDRVYVDGRGQILVAHRDDNTGVDLWKLEDERIEADGKTWKVTGIECFVIGSFRNPEVGLLVTPVA